MTWIRSLVFATCVAATLLPGEAKAQRRYQPPRPTFSPYHDLFRRDNGLLDPYNAQIVPRRRAAQQFSQMQSVIEQQQTEIDGLNQQLLQFSQSGATQTGKGGTFMSHGRYFGVNSGFGAGGGGRASANRRSRR